MEKLMTGYLGHFTLRGYSEPLPDGRFEAHFTVSEDDAQAQLTASGDTNTSFVTEEEAADVGLQAAMSWAERYQPDNREGRN